MAVAAERKLNASERQRSLGTEASAAKSQMPPQTFTAIARPQSAPATMGARLFSLRGESQMSAIERQARFKTGSRNGPRSTTTTSG